MGCCLWGRTESDTSDATQQQQQLGMHYVLSKHLVKERSASLVAQRLAHLPAKDEGLSPGQRKSRMPWGN